MVVNKQMRLIIISCATRSIFSPSSLLFIRPSLRSLSLCLSLGLSSLCQGFLFIRPSLRSFSLHLPLGVSSLRQDFLFIRSSLKSLFLRLPLSIWVGRVEVHIFS
ncbi:hypothetical protein RhiirB3_437145 [Rhizophagus irregularis]|nr:hypothetical protein RhiirB3_437145 [Rhizophagus irregularis]